MTTSRGTWWSVTAFNDELQLLEDAMKGEKEVPEWVRAIHGGREKCPRTGKDHFQGAINTSQVRMSKMKKWLPTSHLELARNKYKLVKYVMKEETAVGEKGVFDNKAYISYESLLEELMRFRYEHVSEQTPTFTPDKERFYRLCEMYVSFRPEQRIRWINSLSDPRFYRIYVQFARFYHIMIQQERDDLDNSSELSDDAEIISRQPDSQTDTAQGVGGSEGTRSARDPESQGLGEEALVADEPRSRRSEGDDADPLAERSDLNEAGQAV